MWNNLDELVTVLTRGTPHSEYNPAEAMNPVFQNDSRTPFTPASQPCELGNYPSYSVRVTGAADAQAGIKFAKDNNIRLVIKNTGHE